MGADRIVAERRLRSLAMNDPDMASPGKRGMRGERGIQLTGIADDRYAELCGINRGAMAVERVGQRCVRDRADHIGRACMAYAQFVRQTGGRGQDLLRPSGRRRGAKVETDLHFVGVNHQRFAIGPHRPHCVDRHGLSEWRAQDQFAAFQHRLRLGALAVDPAGADRFQSQGMSPNIQSRTLQYWRRTTTSFWRGLVASAIAPAMKNVPDDTPRVRFRWSRYQAMMIAVPADKAVRDRLVSALGALVGIIATGLLVGGLAGVGTHMPLLIAPIGAAAVLLFAVPASPMAQPWAVIGGNLVSAVVGVSVALLGAGPMVGAGLAVGAAIAAMALLRCLHPPGGAVALTAVLGGPAIQASGYDFVIAPVGVGTVLLLAMAWGFHRFSGHSYPHVAAAVTEPPLSTDFSRQDLLQAIADYPDVLDVDVADLEGLLHAAEHAAMARRRGRNSSARLAAGVVR